MKIAIFEFSKALSDIFFSNLQNWKKCRYLLVLFYVESLDEWLQIFQFFEGVEDL